MSEYITQKYTCHRCNGSQDITFKTDDFLRWSNGEFIQDVLGYLTPDERELIVRDTCGKCFDILFPPLDNEQ